MQSVLVLWCFICEGPSDPRAMCSPQVELLKPESGSDPTNPYLMHFDEQHAKKRVRLAYKTLTLRNIDPNILYIRTRIKRNQASLSRGGCWIARWRSCRCRPSRCRRAGAISICAPGRGRRRGGAWGWVQLFPFSDKMLETRLYRLDSNGSLGRFERERTPHANLNATTPNWPLSVLGFWDKNTGICAGVMPYRRDFMATTRI